jgi:hypothetical protein
VLQKYAPTSLGVLNRKVRISNAAILSCEGSVPAQGRFPPKERPHMPGSQTTPGPTARSNAPADFAFRQVNNVGTRVANDFAAQWLAYALPYRRFADDLADVCARIGGDVGCHSFIAVDFHHILLASLPAHSLTLRPAE